ncbi:hypothetical protein M378DRAFT_323967 [Amanita muscaria Koide BX008]|uniref:Uncharacterized protein n=1 Tax=Amanita muscaria (strain Koide BX008) TaxID=946122 RepID=A0A0C2TJ90_AMAMK|nr:hypothetical protein M378DRAFT_323967 [Amanita muscaria Koide BX008]
MNSSGVLQPQRPPTRPVLQLNLPPDPSRLLHEMRAFLSNVGAQWATFSSEEKTVVCEQLEVLQKKALSTRKNSLLHCVWPLRSCEQAR